MFFLHRRKRILQNLILRIVSSRSNFCICREFYGVEGQESIYNVFISNGTSHQAQYGPWENLRENPAFSPRTHCPGLVEGGTWAFFSRLTLAYPGFLYRQGGCRSFRAARGCSGSKDQDLGRGGWSPRGRPIAARPQPRPLIGPFLGPAPARPAPEGRRGAALPPPAAAGPCRASAPGLRGLGRVSAVLLRGRVVVGGGGWGNTPGAGLSREKLGSCSEDPSSFFPSPLTALETSSSLSPSSPIKRTHRLQILGLAGTAATAETFV